MLTKQATVYTYELYTLDGEYIRTIESIKKYKLPKKGNFDRFLVGHELLIVKWIA